jgi:predicted nucleotidyltransferase
MKKKTIIQYLTEHKFEFEQQFGVTKIGLFGSYAREEDQKGSDIDIVAELKKPDLLTLVGIKKKIEEELGVSVDIVRYRERMNRTLKKRINQDAVYV